MGVSEKMEGTAVRFEQPGRGELIQQDGADKLLRPVDDKENNNGTDSG